MTADHREADAPSQPEADEVRRPWERPGVSDLGKLEDVTHGFSGSFHDDTVSHGSL